MMIMIVHDKMMMMYSPCTRSCRWLSENGRQRCISARPMLKNVNLSNLNVRSLIYHQVKSQFIFQCESIKQYIYGYGTNLLKIQGGFFHWYPPKKLKYGKHRFDESTLTYIVLDPPKGRLQILLCRFCP